MGLFRADEERVVRELFAGLEREVELVFVDGPSEAVLLVGRDVDPVAETRELLAGLAELGELVSFRKADGPEERYPAIRVLVEGEDTGVRYYGLPWGYELSSIVGAVVEAGRGEPSLGEGALAVLDALERDVRIDVFVTPT
jgi:alkyl hydroperoxide reductase subunit AhpF